MVSACSNQKPGTLFVSVCNAMALCQFNQYSNYLLAPLDISDALVDVQLPVDYWLLVGVPSANPLKGERFGVLTGSNW